MAWLPVYVLQLAGIGPTLPPVDGPRVLDRLASSLALSRAASSADLACAAAALAALSALVCASFWSAERPEPSGALSGAAAASTARTFDVVRCWDFRSEIRTPPTRPPRRTRTERVLNTPIRGRSRITKESNRRGQGPDA